MISQFGETVRIFNLDRSLYIYKCFSLFRPYFVREAWTCGQNIWSCEKKRFGWVFSLFFYFLYLFCFQFVSIICSFKLYHEFGCRNNNVIISIFTHRAPNYIRPLFHWFAQNRPRPKGKIITMAAWQTTHSPMLQCPLIDQWETAATPFRGICREHAATRLGGNVTMVTRDRTRGYVSEDWNKRWSMNDTVHAALN